MTPARSLVAGVAALGFASTITVPLPASAASPESSASMLAHAAPAPCERAGRYAAQAEAELLRIERLDLRGTVRREHGAGITKRDSGERPSVEASESAGEVLKQFDADTPAAGGTAAPGGPAASGGPAAPGGNSDSAADVANADSGGSADADSGGTAGSGRNASSGKKAGTGKSAGSGTDPGDSAGDAAGGDGPVASGQSGKGGAKSPESATNSGGLLSGLGGLLGGLVPVAYHPTPPASGDDRTEMGQPGEPGTGDVSPKDGDAKQVIADVGIGDARSVMITDAPVKSAAAGLMLDGRVAGVPAAEQVLQQAPPAHAKPIEQHTGSKRFGPVQVDAGTMSAHAGWDPATGCGAAGGEISRSSTQLDRVTLNGALVHVPEKASSLTSTALSGRGSRARSVASATVITGRVELAGEVRIRVLRAPTLRVSMSAAEGGEVRYQPAVAEVSGPGISRTRLDINSDQIDITVSDAGRVTESATVPLLPSQGSLLPSIPGLPAPSSGSAGGGSAGAPVLESTPAGRTVVRVSLGDVRQASKGHALAARVTAIKVAVLRVDSSDEGRGGKASASSAVVADLGIGVLEAAAVAPDPGRRSVESGVQGGMLPVTGPRSAPMFIMGAGLLVGGVCAFLLGARRRRRAS